MGARRRTAALLGCLFAVPAALPAAAPAQAYDPAHLKQVLTDGRCPGCDLSGAKIVDEDLRKAYLPGANLSGADLTVTNFSGADLSGANLEGADLSIGVFTGTILDGANLRNVQVDGTDFTGASLSGADVAGVAWDNAKGARLEQAKGVPAGYVEPPPAPPPTPAPSAVPPLSPAPMEMAGQRLGSVMLMATPFCPAGTLPAAGARLPIQQHAALFSLYGTNFGGNGREDFALPDLRQHVPAPDLRYCIVADGAFPERH